jgi:hypothetical protein
VTDREAEKASKITSAVLFTAKAQRLGRPIFFVLAQDVCAGSATTLPGIPVRAGKGR